MADFIVSFDDPRSVEPSVTGGKGASLASLSRAGFEVPEALVVTAACYRSAMDAWPELDSMVRGLPVGPGGSPERLREACAGLRSAMTARPLPAGVERELRARLGPLTATGPVSVRSSATLEDLAGSAFAGQHDSFLGVVGLENVIQRVVDCWASLWEDRAVRYRIERGFDMLDPEMAVVVQRMVSSEVAGVAFSLHPITGETDRVLVTGAWGLGETVVGGEGEVDQWVLEKRSGRILESRLGSKVHEIVQTPSGGTERRDVPSELRERSCLDDVMLSRLCDLVRRVERHYLFPQDVEWAVVGRRLYLLQSRPVTDLPPRWTRQESAERFPNPVTPLTWDFTTEGFHESLAHSLRLMGMPPFDGEWFARKDGYVYGNQTAVEVFAAGHQVAFDDLDDLAARVPRMREAYRWVQELPVHWARDLDRYLLELGRLGALDLRGAGLQQLWAHALEIDRVGRAYFLPNIAISITQGLLHRLLFSIVTHVVGSEQAPNVYDGLTCHCETKTGLVNADLYALASVARRDEELTARITSEDRRTLVESSGLDAYPEFAEALRRFLEIHGHREVDFDAYHPTWVGQPWVVLENIRLMLLQPALEDPGVKDQELRARQLSTEQTFLTAVPDELRTFVGEVVRLARTYTALDDLEHYQTTRLTPPFRAVLVEIGARLVEIDVLEEPSDVFFLRRRTLEALVDGSCPVEEGRAEVALAKGEYTRALTWQPPLRHGEDDEEIDESEGLRGLPGAPGVAEGPVCLVRSPEDFGRFVSGSVLVARTTNPAWTPLFYSAVAVVTESGGPLSHGAVTAREFGIPAVMAVRGALARLSEGDRVRIDGARGVVSRVGETQRPPLEL